VLKKSFSNAVLCTFQNSRYLQQDERLVNDYNFICKRKVLYSFVSVLFNKKYKGIVIIGGCLNNSK